MKDSRHGNGLGAERSESIRAIAAFSGGLDSILAGTLAHRAGIDIILLHVKHLWSGGKEAEERLRAAAARVGLPLRIVDATVEHLDVVRHPRHGYGVGVNPCVDCHIFMLKIAKRVMEEEGAHFVVTGEVLGQRPKSQHYKALLEVAEESGLGSRLVRPLSANLLPDTLPVERGWLRRENLLSIQGRGRDAQLTLAEHLGIRDFPQPAGGCLLTEKVYAARVRDAFAHVGKANVGVEEFELLGVGRHFRLSEDVKVVVGRDEGENATLARLAADRVRIDPVDIMGPTVLVEGAPSDDDLALAGALGARYGDHAGRHSIRLKVLRSGAEKTIDVVPLDPADPRIAAWRLGG
ncbi:MAG: tRNA 4-thiouridine(8) synthase ThiI [Candidatus Bipolaricaulota bacterium]|nr:tRNA 4-thiouridine(8) synthase ThiI [Candidatus Bipolaricaulota bacterium]